MNLWQQYSILWKLSETEQCAIVTTLALSNLHTIKIHAPDFDCCIDGSSDASTANVNNLPTESDVTLSPDFESSEHPLPLLLSNRPVPQHIPPIPFKHVLAHPKPTPR